MSPVRIGVLGAARIVKQALMAPAANVPEVEVLALAARDSDRARAHAEKLGIPRVHDGYAALLDDPDVDAVYIALPNSLHAEWSIRAMEAGKHVLCEKPITSCEQEAQLVADVAARTGRIVCEGMHPYYHGLADRVGELLADGVVGEVRHAEAHVAFPIPGVTDIRWEYALAGGALMDLGVYAVAILRLLAGADPVEVSRVTVKTRTPDVDRYVDAHLHLPGGATGRIVTSMWGWPVIASKGAVEGTSGRLTVHNPMGPHLFHRIVVESGGRKRSETVARRPDTYTSQLKAFADAVRLGAPPRTGPAYFVPNMRVIDAIYRTAGLPLRGAARTP